MAQEYTTLADLDLIESNKTKESADNHFFNNIVAKLLYLGKKAKPYRLLAVQFQTTKVQASTASDGKKLTIVISYLKSTKHNLRTVS